MMEAVGLPRPKPGEPALAPAEASVLGEPGGWNELWPAEARIRTGRAYCGMRGAITGVVLQAFEMHAAAYLREQRRVAPD